MDLYIIYDFSNPFYFKKEILGKEFSITIEGKNAKIIFPKIADNVKTLIENDTLYFSKSIIQPNIDVTNLNPDLDWGHLLSYPDMEIEVKHIIITFSEDHKDVICHNLNNYFSILFNYLKIFSKKIIEKNAGTFKNFQIHRIENGNFIKIPNNNEFHFGSLVIGKNQSTISLETFTKALSFSSTREIPLEYKLLLNAYSAVENKDYRSSVVEATSALEISLSSKILSELDTINFPEPLKLLDKYKMAGGKFQLAELLHIAIPTKDYKEKILIPRNNVIHQGSFIDKESAITAIHEVEKYLDAFSPLN